MCVSYVYIIIIYIYTYYIIYILLYMCILLCNIHVHKSAKWLKFLGRNLHPYLVYLEFIVLMKPTPGIRQHGWENHRFCGITWEKHGKYGKITELMVDFPASHAWQRLKKRASLGRAAKKWVYKSLKKTTNWSERSLDPRSRGQFFNLKSHGLSKLSHVYDAIGP